MSDDLVSQLREMAAGPVSHWPLTAGRLCKEAAAKIERLRAALRTSHMQLASKMAGKRALSDEKYLSILQAALPSGNKTRLEKEVERLRSALAECCAPFDTGPTTVLEGAVLVQAEFQRRMDLAANTLR